MLGTSELIDNTAQWQEYSISATLTNDYDRLLVLVSSQDALTGVPQPRDATFLAIDNLAYSTTRDTDGDGIGDHCDLDSDNDGISDLEESQALARGADVNNDGTVSEAESLAWLQANVAGLTGTSGCLLYTSPSPRDKRQSRMPSSA